MGFGFADLVVAVPAFWVDVADMTDLDAAAAEFRAGTATGCGWRRSITSWCAPSSARTGSPTTQLVDSQGATEGR